MPLQEAAAAYTADVREFARLVGEFLSDEDPAVGERFRALLSRRATRDRRLISNLLDVVLQVEYLLVALFVGAIVLGGRGSGGAGAAPPAHAKLPRRDGDRSKESAAELAASNGDARVQRKKVA